MQRPIEVATCIGARFAHVCEILTNGSDVVFGDDAATHQDSPTRTVLTVDLGSGTSVHQEVLVHLGVAHTTEAALVVPVAWEATGRKRVLPSFAGELEASEADDGTRLRLHGTYAVPLGVIGRIGNGVVGWRLACRSLEVLLVGVGRRVEVEVDRRRRTVADPVTPEWEHSEIYIG